MEQRVSINVCVSTSNSIFSRVIRWFTRSQVSHAFLTFYDETLGRVFVMEANGRGFMLVPWSNWKKHNTVVARFSLKTPEVQQLHALQRLSNLLGATYDYVSVLGFVLRRFRRRMRNPLNDAAKLICSEVVARFLFDTGDPLLLVFAESETWTPEDILREARKNPTFVEVTA